MKYFGMWSTEVQFEAYRALGEHIGDKIFLPSLTSHDDGPMIEMDAWFSGLGGSLLPISITLGTTDNLHGQMKEAEANRAKPTLVGRPFPNKANLADGIDIIRRGYRYAIGA